MTKSIKRVSKNFSRVNKVLVLGAFLLIFAASNESYSQINNAAVSGTVYEAVSKEVLTGATVFNPGSGKGTVTNAYGRYTLWVSVNCDSTEIVFDYIGYEPFTIVIPCKSQFLDCYLTPSAFDIDEVNVYSTRSALKPEMALFRLNTQQLRGLPSFAGEKDLLLYLQLAPGSQIAGDGNSNLYVRGGSHDQNLFLLDDIPLYHVSHLGGFTSTFNSDIIKSANFYVGAFPARFGGRLSSVVDIHTRDGDMSNHRQSVTLGMLTSKVSAEGPIITDRSSYLISYRRNTIPFLRWIWDIDQSYGMYDLNLKINSHLSDKDRLFLSFYNGSDNLGIKTKDDEVISSKLNNRWGNLSGALRYNRIVNQRAWLNVIAGSTRYAYKENSFIDLRSQESYQMDSGFESWLRDDFVKFNFDFRANEKISILLGSALVMHTYHPGHTQINQSTSGVKSESQISGYPSGKALNPNIYGEFILSDFYGFGLNAGIRASKIYYSDTDFLYYEPRIILTRRLIEGISLKGSYSHMYQHFHLVSNNSAGMPTDYRIPASQQAPPSTTRLASLGVSFVSYDGLYEASFEAYHKHMSNLVDLREGMSYVLGSDFTKILAGNGTGDATGIEFLYQKHKGSSTGWISATLAKADRRFEDINFGEKFPFKYDRRFSVSTLYNQKINDNISIAFTWVFGTGLPFSFPHEQYEDLDGSIVFIYKGINGFRDRAYHRADVGLSWTRKKNSMTGVWDFGIINLYNRRNPHFYFTRFERGSPKLYRFSLFPIMPSVSYSLSF
jgi:hypothetical protein